jgi:hypothetical protein
MDISEFIILCSFSYPNIVQVFGSKRIQENEEDSPYTLSIISANISTANGGPSKQVKVLLDTSSNLTLAKLLVVVPEFKERIYWEIFEGLRNERNSVKLSKDSDQDHQQQQPSHSNGGRKSRQKRRRNRGHSETRQQDRHLAYSAVYNLSSRLPSFGEHVIHHFNNQDSHQRQCKCKQILCSFSNEKYKITLCMFFIFCGLIFNYFSFQKNM